MHTAQKHSVLAEAAGPIPGRAAYIKDALLVLSGVLILALGAKIAVPMWPVPVTMGTFTVLVLGAAYGPRLGLPTIALYMICGAFGMDVFANSSAENHGLAYMGGATGGYLLGYVLATLALGFAARKGWDRSPLQMAGAMLIGNVLIYLPGLLWLGRLYGWDKPILEWGLTPFLVGDALKLTLAAVLLPTAWKMVSRIKR